MIRINLVPQEQRPKKKYRAFSAVMKDVPLEVSVGLVGAFLVLVLAVNVALQAVVIAGAVNNKRLEAIWQGMGAERSQVDKIGGDLDQMRQKLAAIDYVKKGMKVSWSQKLNIMSDVLLSGVWLSHLSLDKDKMEIKGWSVSKKGDYLASINRFNAALKKDPNFMKGIKSIDVSSVERKTLETAGLASFVMTATLDKNYEQAFNP